MAAIALDIGGTKIQGALYRPDGVVIDTHRRLLEGRTGEAVGALALEITRELLTRAVGRGIEVSGLGVCVPGIVYRTDGSVWAPNIPGWERYPLRRLLTDAFPGMYVSVDNDRSCSIYGETWLGAAAGCRDAVFVAVGTGIGLGIKVDGNVLHGLGDIAGAAGWMALRPPYDHDYDPVGCFEYYASGNGIGARARDMLAAAGRDSLGNTHGLDRVTSHDVFDAWDSGDPVARAVVARAIEMWGMGAANMVSLFNPELIVWGGGVFGPAARFIDDIRREAEKWAQPVAMTQVKFIPSRADFNAMMAGAAFIAFNRP